MRPFIFPNYSFENKRTLLERFFYEFFNTFLKVVQKLYCRKRKTLFPNEMLIILSFPPICCRNSSNLQKKIVCPEPPLHLFALFAIHFKFFHSLYRSTSCLHNLPYITASSIFRQKGFFQRMFTTSEPVKWWNEMRERVSVWVSVCVCVFVCVYVCVWRDCWSRYSILKQRWSLSRCVCVFVSEWEREREWKRERRTG